MEFSLPFGETKVRSQKWQLLGRREQEEWRAVGVAYRLGEADTDPMPSGPPPLGWQGDLGGFAPRHAPRDGRPSQAAPRRGGAGHSKEMEGNLGSGHQYPGKVGGDSCSHGQGVSFLLAVKDMKDSFPNQNMHKPSHFPYNKRMEPRRLDYLILRGLESEGTDMGEFRDIMGSDHEPILGTIKSRAGARRKVHPNWGARQLTTKAKQVAKINQILQIGGDYHDILSKAAAVITEPKKGEKFVESRGLKQLRRRAKEAGPGDQRRILWKAVCTARRSEQRAWLRDLANRAGEQHWGALRVFKHPHKPQDCKLTEPENWREQLEKYFSGIFAKTPKGADDNSWATGRGPAHALQTYAVAAVRRGRTPSHNEQVALEEKHGVGWYRPRSPSLPYGGAIGEVAYPGDPQRRSLHR